MARIRPKYRRTRVLNLKVDGTCVRCKGKIAKGHGGTIYFFRWGESIQGRGCSACAMELRMLPANHAPWPKRFMGDNDRKFSKIPRRLVE